MRTSCKQSSNQSKKSEKHKKNGPLTREQQALIEEWYVHAMAVAYKNARRPYDHDEVRTVAHDALISTARYYQEDGASKSFLAFYKFCLLRLLARTFHKRIAHAMPHIPDGMDIPYTPGVALFEVQEFTTFLQKKLPANQREILHQIYDIGMNHNEIASMRGCEHQNISSIHSTALRDMWQRANWSYVVPYTGPDAFPIPEPALVRLDPRQA